MNKTAFLLSQIITPIVATAWFIYAVILMVNLSSYAKKIDQTNPNEVRKLKRKFIFTMIKIVALMAVVPISSVLPYFFF